MTCDAITNSVDKLSDPDYSKLLDYEVEERNVLLDKPLFSRGGFVLTFKIKHKKTKRDYALRVFYKENPINKERGQKVSSYLKDHPSDYFKNYDYICNGLKIYDEQKNQEEWKDVILMEWIDGKTLFNYIKELKNKLDTNKLDILAVKKQLHYLAVKVKDMFKWLHKHRISHGDLQHDNILISDDKVVLCDYDSLYVPSFTDEKQVTNGYPGYQHPLRLHNNYKASYKDDYFSEIIIYLGLLALSMDPDLWSQDEDNDDRFFIFNEEDFNNIKENKECALYEKLLNWRPNSAEEGKTIEIIKNLLHLLKINLQCTDYHKIRPIPGLDTFYCSFCGNEIKDHYLFCPNCRYRISKQKVYYDNYI